MERIEMRNGRKVKVTESRSLTNGDVAEFVEPVDGDCVENAAMSVQNVPTDPVTGQPIARFNYEQQEADALEPLPTPVFNFGQPQPKPEAETDADGQPVLTQPVFNWNKSSPKQTAKPKTVANETDDGTPVLPTPGHGA